MIKRTGIIFLCILLTACANTIVNTSFDRMGFFDDYSKIEKLQTKYKQVIFIPMHHLGTKSFYDNVAYKVDSLQNIGYHFYFEKTSLHISDTISLLKARKLTGVSFTRNNVGFKRLFDSLYNGKIKYKKELIDQPSYKALGLDSLNARNVDVTVKEMIQYYEMKYGEIKLEKCDYENINSDKYPCNRKDIKDKNQDDAMVNFRNQHVVNELLKEKRDKIAIIYGANHFIGIKEELLKHGFIETTRGAGESSAANPKKKSKK